MRLSLLLASLLAVGASPCAVADPTRDAWNEPRASFRIVGNTWYVGTQGISVLLVRGEQGAVLIDAALPESGPHLRASLAALGVEPEEIKLILTSHAHFDHVGALSELKALTGARVLASPDSAALLAAGGKGDLHFGDSGPYPPVVVDGTLADGERVTLGDLAFTAHLTPGHTPGSTTWSWVERDGARHLQMVYADSVTAPGYQLLDHPKRPGLVEDFRQSFAELRSIPCDVLITPHPEASDLFLRMEADRMHDGPAQSGPSLVDANACRRYADRAERALDARIAEQRKSAP